MSRSLKTVAALLLLCLASCTSSEGPGTISGVVTWRDRPIAMAWVEAYPKPERDPATPPVAEAPTAEDGSYQLRLPAGRYWLWAKANPPASNGDRERRLVGEAAANPVRVTPGGEHRADVALRDATGFRTSAGPAGTGAEGRVTGAAGPEVTVYAYRGVREKPVGPDFVAAVAADEEGLFRLDLRPGAYSLAARWRASGADFGHLRVGDRVAVVTVTVPQSGYAGAGTLEMRPVDPVVWEQRDDALQSSRSTISGRITDREGNPKAGIRVLAFHDPRMAGKPVALSSPTGAGGAFMVRLPEPGVYYLGARSRIGGPTQPGEWTGAYRGEDEGGVRVGAEESLEGTVIEVEEVW